MPRLDKSMLMLPLLARLRGDVRGVTAVEYALIICLVSLVAIGSMNTLGVTLFNLGGPIATALR